MYIIGYSRIRVGSVFPLTYPLLTPYFFPYLPITFPSPYLPFILLQCGRYFSCCKGTALCTRTQIIMLQNMLQMLQRNKCNIFRNYFTTSGYRHHGLLTIDDIHTRCLRVGHLASQQVIDTGFHAVALHPV